MVLYEYNSYLLLQEFQFRLEIVFDSDNLEYQKIPHSQKNKSIFFLL